MTDARHVPVLLGLPSRASRPPSTTRELSVDCTSVWGGHTEAVLQRCDSARVVGIDRDPEAPRRAGRGWPAFDDRFTGVHAVYDEIPTSPPSSACPPWMP